LLVVAHGVETMSSPSSPANLAIETFRGLDAPTRAAGLAQSLERVVSDLRGTFRNALAGDPRWNGTASMFTALLRSDARMAIAHIGDTRAYLLRGGQLTQLTHDHTLGQLLADEGHISTDEIGSDQKHSLIVRLLDGEQTEPADVTLHETVPGDRYLLATCGIQDAFSAGQLHEVLGDTERSPKDVANDIVAKAPPADGLAVIVADAVAAAEASDQVDIKFAGPGMR
jgi:protein phosphatase